MGAQKWPPNPQTLVAPRRSRVAPRARAWPGGPEMAPQTPKRSSRPGEAGSLLGRARGLGAQKWPPNPQTLVAPRQSRVAPRARAWPGGPEMAPNPQTLVAPRRSRVAPRARAWPGGPEMAPKPQGGSERP